MSGWVDVVSARAWRQGGQAEPGAYPLAVRIGAAVWLPGFEFAAGAGASFINAAVDFRRADFTAQRNAAGPALFGAFHGSPQGAYLADQFRWYDSSAAIFSNFTAIERHPEVRTTGAAVQARVVHGRVV